MSLINKMLQDLDARGTPAGGAFQIPAKTVERESARTHWRARLQAGGAGARVAGVVLAGALAGVGLAWSGWSWWQHRHPAPLKPVAQASLAPSSKPAVQPAVAPPAPSAPPVPATAGEPAPQASAGPTGPAANPVASPAAAPQPAAGQQVPAAAAPVSVPAHSAAATRTAAPQAAHAKDVAPLEPDSLEARAVRRALALELDARGRTSRTLAGAKPRKAGAARGDATLAAATGSAAGAAPNAGADNAAPAGRQESAGQRAEAQYRRALASMQEGRLGETVAALEAALRIEPSHEAARQTLVGLLVEAGRLDEAMRQLQLGLTLDARQPAMAMLLARLLVERGEAGLQSAVDTLTRTLPFAGNDPDYRALLAGALQRQGRHREAAEQYAQAVAVSGKAVWWMGMGISLQADKRAGEALDAFRKALAAGLPSPALQSFVERRIQQLER